MAPPALAPVACSVSKVLASAISVCSIWISAAPVATPRLAKGLDKSPLISSIKPDKEVTSEKGLVTACLFASNWAICALILAFSAAAAFAAFLAALPPIIPPATLPNTPIPAATIIPDILFLFYLLLFEAALCSYQHRHLLLLPQMFLHPFCIHSTIECPHAQK